MDILKWANATAAKKAGSRQIRSFKDPSLTTGIFLLDLLEGIKPGIVDPALIMNVSDSGDYDDRKQNGGWLFFLHSQEHGC
jgi:plastin-1